MGAQANRMTGRDSRWASGPGIEGEKVVGEERLLKDLQPKPERIRDVRQGPDGAIYMVTDSATGRIIKLVPKKG